MRKLDIKLSNYVWIFTILTVLALLLGLISLKHRQQTIDINGIAFNSMSWHVRIADVPNHLSEDNIKQELDNVLEQVDQSLSSWRADSEVSTFNRLSIHTPIQVSPLLYHSLLKATLVNHLMPNVYDVTVSPLIDLWGFGPQGRPTKIPTLAQIQAAKANIGWQYMVMQNSASVPYSVSKNKDIQINLSSLGEGAGVDAMRGWLESHGMHNFMIAIAGTVIVSGDNHHQPWQIAIEKPDGSQMISSVLPLSNAVVSTSGSYRNYYEVNGIRYSHTIDPRTGKPITHHGVSVTLIYPLSTDPYAATYVDAMTTGLNVLGAEQGILLADQKGFAVYYIENEKNQLVEKNSRAYQKYHS